MTDLDGHPLPHNPLKDLRVRQALTMSIDRAGLVGHVIAGQAVAAGQFTPDWVAGAAPTSSRRLLISSPPANS